MSGAAATSFTVAGLEFSDELGGFRLISVSGTGTAADPIVIVEEITDVGPAILVIRGRQMARSADGKDYPTSFINLAVIKVAINATERVWTGYDLELQEILKTPSPYQDGLSFDQLRSFSDEPFQADAFANTRRLEEPYDRVRFHQGSVDPGSAVRFNLFITDPTPAPVFYLLQEPQLLVAGTPTIGRQLAARPDAPAR